MSTLEKLFSKRDNFHVMSRKHDFVSRDIGIIAGVIVFYQWQKSRNILMNAVILRKQQLSFSRKLKRIILLSQENYKNNVDIAHPLLASIGCRQRCTLCRVIRCGCGNRRRRIEGNWHVESGGVSTDCDWLMGLCHAFHEF